MKDKSYKTSEATRRATARYLAGKKGMNIYFDKDVYEEIRSYGINVSYCRDLILSDLESRKAGVPVKVATKTITLKSGEIADNLSQIKEAIELLNQKIDSIAGNMAVNTSNKPTEAILETVSKEVQPEIKTAIQEEKISTPGWLDI